MDRSDPKKGKRLLDQVRDKIRLKHYSIRTEKCYIDWIKRYIFFHGKRHPKEMSVPEIEAFLTDLAIRCNVAPSTQNQAFNAILFLYKQVLEIEFDADRINAVRAKNKIRVPVVLTKDEVAELVCQMEGVYQLIGKIIYGSGMPILECLRLRVHNIDFGNSEIHLMDTKGYKDRITFLPESIHHDLKIHLDAVKLLHNQDLNKGLGDVYLPHALERKYKNASREWNWQYVFPSRTLSVDPRTGIKRRHHIHESAFGREIKKAFTKSIGFLACFGQCFHFKWLSRFWIA